MDVRLSLHFFSVTIMPGWWWQLRLRSAASSSAKCGSSWGWSHHTPSFEAATTGVLQRRQMAWHGSEVVGSDMFASQWGRRRGCWWLRLFQIKHLRMVIYQVCALSWSFSSASTPWKCWQMLTTSQIFFVFIVLFWEKRKKIRLRLEKFGICLFSGHFSKIRKEAVASISQRTVPSTSYSRTKQCYTVLPTLFQWVEMYIKVSKYCMTEQTDFSFDHSQSWQHCHQKLSCGGIS